MRHVAHGVIQPGRSSRNLKTCGQHGVVQFFDADLPLAKLGLHPLVHDLLFSVAGGLLTVTSCSLVDVFGFGIGPGSDSEHRLLSAHVGEGFALPLVFVVFENELNVGKRRCDLRSASPSLLHPVPTSTTKGDADRT